MELAGRPGATPALVESLLALDADTTPEPVRRRVVSSLAATGDDRALDRLLTVATKGADYASVAAGEIGNLTTASPAMRTRVLELAGATTDENLKTHAVRALGALRVEASVPMLTGLVGSSSALLRIEAVIALGRVGPASAPAVDALAEAYDGGDEALRQHVAIALGRIANERAYAILKQFQTVEKSEKVKTTLGGAVRSIDARSPR